MVQCPFCQFDNEDGALFCEQCKSDLGACEPVASVASVLPVAEALPLAEVEIPEAVIAEAVPLASAIPAAEILAEAVPVEAIPVSPAVGVPEPVAEAVPLASPAVPDAPLAPAAVAQSTQPGTTPSPPPISAAPAPAAAGELPQGAQPRLVVLRGQKRNVEYPIYEGHNFIGRSDEKPVDIDLEDQEPPDRVWSSRQHALISYENNRLEVEDLNSSNGTFVNRQKIYPGQKRPLLPNDVIQIGTVQLKLVV